MATYLELVNQLAEDLRWNTISEAEFPDPPRPIPAIKRILNEAKDEVLPRMGQDLVEKTFSFETPDSLTDPDTTVTLTTTGTTVTASASLFTSDMAGRKIQLPQVEYINAATALTTGLKDPTPHKISSFDSATQLTVDRGWIATGETAAAATGFQIYQDEFDLDDNIRQVLEAWTSEGPLDLEFVKRSDSVKDVDLGTPEKLIVFRSETTAKIWRVQLVPAPRSRQWIYYRGVIHIDDLSAFDDTWELEPEVVRIIKDRALMKLLGTPVQNDLEMALFHEQNTRARMDDWVDTYGQPDPPRRRRRRGPDEPDPTRTVKIVYDIRNPS